MVVDDDLFVRSVLRQTLHGIAKVVEVGDGAEVISIYKKHLPDLIFLDIHLPNRTGLELLEEITAFDPDAHIVMLSADSSLENVSKGKDSGIKAFLTKPFSRDRVMAYLHRCPTVVFKD